jgi:ferredoxin/flavodoxin---NADP+ reductase
VRYGNGGLPSTDVREPRLNAVVTLRNQVSPWLMILQVVADSWDLPDFIPGQYTCLGLYGSAPRCSLAEPETRAPAPDKLIQRAYSIASSPLDREFMEFYLNLVPAGVLTPRLFDLQIGDRIWLSPRITGSFTFNGVPEDANVVFIANGSGLAPYMSMLSTHLAFLHQRRVTLVHGARHSCDLAYRSVLMSMQRLRPNFTYLPVISRPREEPVPWNGATGHVQDLWQSGAITHDLGCPPTHDNTHVFLCGSPEMIESMIALLLKQGFQEHTTKKPGQIHSERYWPAKVGARQPATILGA